MRQLYKKESKTVIYFFFAIYVISVVIGLFIPFGNYNTLLANFNSYDFFISILKNNMFVYILLIIGCITASITTYVSIFFNGFMLGINTPLVINLGTSIIFGTLLHGVFEFLGFFFGALIGLKSIEFHLKNPLEAVKVLLLGFVCIVLGAFIEGYMSPMFINGIS